MQLSDRDLLRVGKALESISSIISIYIYTHSLLGTHGTQPHCGHQRHMQTIPVLICFPCASMIKYYEESSLKRRGFLWLTMPEFKESQGRDSRQEARRNSACWLTLLFMFS